MQEIPADMTFIGDDENEEVVNYIHSFLLTFILIIGSRH